jgi:hypothetical protein
MTDAPSNRRPADQLADLRRRISDLKDQEKELRAGFISGALDPVGDDVVVTIEVKPNQRIDLDLMREHDESIWKPFLIEKPITYVNCRKRAR